MTSMKDDIKKDVTSIYDKTHEETSQSLKKYTDGINTLRKQAKQSWAFVGLKEALFWCMCLAMLLYVGGSVLNVYRIDVPVGVWQLLYPCTFIPIVFYVIRKIAKK